MYVYKQSKLRIEISVTLRQHHAIQFCLKKKKLYRLSICTVAIFLFPWQMFPLNTCISNIKYVWCMRQTDTLL